MSAVLPELDEENWTSDDFVRDMPVDYTLLVENLLDPGWLLCKLPYAAHSILCNTIWICSIYYMFTYFGACLPCWSDIGKCCVLRIMYVYNVWGNIVLCGCHFTHAGLHCRRCNIVVGQLWAHHLLGLLALVHLSLSAKRVATGSSLPLTLS